MEVGGTEDPALGVGTLGETTPPWNVGTQAAGVNYRRHAGVCQCHTGWQAGAAALQVAQ